VRGCTVGGGRGKKRRKKNYASSTKTNWSVEIDKKGEEKKETALHVQQIREKRKEKELKTGKRTRSKRLWGPSPKKGRGKVC